MAEIGKKINVGWFGVLAFACAVKSWNFPRFSCTA